MTNPYWNDALNLPSLEQKYGLPQGLLSSVLQTESGGNPAAVSPAGAQGLFQFMPNTAKQYGIDPTDPAQSADGAARMYADLSKKYGGNLPQMLAAYNWGQGNLDRQGIGNAPKETNDYIGRVTDGMASAQSQANAPGMLQMAKNAIMPDAQAADTPAGQEVTDPAILAQLNQSGGDSGTEVTDPALLAQLNSPASPMASTAVDNAVQGATFGFGDEIEAGLAAPILSLMNGKSVSDNYKSAHDYAQKQLDQEQSDHPVVALTSNLAGSLGGGIAGLGTKAGAAASDFLRSGNALARFGKAAAAGSASGGLYGFGSAADGQGVAGAESGALAGAALGGTLSGLGSALSGVKSAVGLPSVNDALRGLAQKAVDLGIPLSRSQIGDSGFAKLLSSTANQLPFSGGVKFAQSQQKAFNRAIAGTIGQSAEEITPNVINQAYDDIGNGFNALQQGQKVTVTPDHIDQLANIENDASQWITGDHANVVKNAVSKVLDDLAPDGTIAGEKLGSLRSLLTQKLKGQPNDATPYLSQIRDLTMDMATGGDPQKQAALDALRMQYKNLKTIEPLAAKAQASGGDISPSLLRGAVSKSYNLARGQGGQLGDLANIGQAFLKDPVPDSGTAKRLMVLGGLTEIPSAAVASLAGNPLPLMTPFAAMGSARLFNTLNHSQPAVQRALGASAPGGLLSFANKPQLAGALASYRINRSNP